MDTPNLKKYFELRKKLLEHRENNKDYDVYGTKAYHAEEEILCEMDEVWYKQLTDEEREYLRTAPANVQ